MHVSFQWWFREAENNQLFRKQILINFFPFFYLFIATDKGTKPAPKAAKAAKAAGALKKGSGRKATRVHTKVHFYKPKTLQLARKPKVLARASKSVEGNKSFDVVKFPLTTESAMKKIEDHNTLVFIVNITANKAQIKAAIQNLYDIKVQKVNTLIRYVYLSIYSIFFMNVFVIRGSYVILFRPDGQKKAYVKLTSDFEAADVANRLAII